MLSLEAHFKDPVFVAGFSLSTALLFASPWIITTIARLAGISF